MKKKVTPYLAFLLFSLLGVAQQLPGGVDGAEVWYIADGLDVNNLENKIPGNIDIQSCGDLQLGLLNFNPSIYSEESLCFKYRGPLESSSSKNIFIVSEPDDLIKSYPHISTKFGNFPQAPPLDSLSRNTYVIETNKGYASRMGATFNQHQNANVYFYGWNNFDIDKKFKSYGELGETLFTIGESFDIPGKFQQGERYFSGLLPEYVAFNRQLSKNEQNRVESYLALKYGITKWNTDSYKSSKNKTFWDEVNNNLFSNNIFGIGRDNLSGLNQLQCESAHNKDYLVAAIYEIMGTNAEVQDNYSIESDNFLVFGDTGGDGVLEPEEVNIRRLEKVWLAQITGETMSGAPIHFRLDLEKAFPDFIPELQEDVLTLWMLHDPIVNNTSVSDFDNGNVEYYTPVNFEVGPSGQYYAHFKDDGIVHFDRDKGFFDQFTFAVGPECIAKFRPRYPCDEVQEASIECYELDIILTGQCEGEYMLTDNDGKEIKIWYNEEQSEINQKPTYTANICATNRYTFEMNLHGSQFEYYYDAEPIGPYIVDLGDSVQILNAQQTKILLDAGQYMPDPKTTFQWFYNGTQLYHYASTLWADQPGEYCVVVTTPDGVCKIRKCVNVVTELEAIVICQSGYCDKSKNEIHIDILSGTPPFSITIQDGNGQTTNHTTHNTQYMIPGVDEGLFTITITDYFGAVYQGSCEISSGFENALSLGPDLTLSSATPQFTLDASALWNGPQNYNYQWIRNGVLLSDTGPTLIVTTPGTYTVKVLLDPYECYGYASQNVFSVLEASITETTECDEMGNGFEVDISYGFPLYTTTINGIQGTVYHDVIYHSGNISLSGLPFGDYEIVLTDRYQNSLQHQIQFTGMGTDLENQMGALCVSCNCQKIDNFCGTDRTAYFFNNSNCANTNLHLDASTLISPGRNVVYEWSLNGIILNHFDPELDLINSDECINTYQNGEFCDGLEITVTITDLESGCTVTETVITDKFWCPVLTPPLPRGYETNIYPNPTSSQDTFFYNIKSISQESFDGKVEVYSMLGSLIYILPLQGKADYTLPFQLVASGVYLVRTTTDDGTVTVDRVIIK